MKVLTYRTYLNSYESIRSMKRSNKIVLMPLKCGTVTAKFHFASVMAQVNNSESIVNNQCKFAKLK